jgi:transketolase
MLEKKFLELKQKSFNTRQRILKIATNGGCFIGASLSCLDLLIYLYSDYLNISINNLNDPERDYFFLSKGHAVPALYGTFVELNFIPKERLNNHLKVNDNVYWHPNRTIPGVEFHSGSLGHSLPIATGVALDCKIKNQSNKIVVLIGDGELNEGSNWETLLVASAYKLDNLIIIIDRNQCQANLRTEDLIPLEPLAKKFESFGCAVRQIDGHDFLDMEEKFSKIPFEKNNLNVIIADTIRGKGIPAIESKLDKWFCNFTNDEVEKLLDEMYLNSNFS